MEITPPVVSTGAAEVFTGAVNLTPLSTPTMYFTSTLTVRLTRLKVTEEKKKRERWLWPTSEDVIY